MSFKSYISITINTIQIFDNISEKIVLAFLCAVYRSIEYFYIITYRQLYRSTIKGADRARYCFDGVQVIKELSWYPSFPGLGTVHLNVGANIK